MIVMTSQPILETTRLILRPFKLSDAKQVQKLAGDKQIASPTQNIPHPYEDGMADTWINKHPETYNEGKGVAYAITLTETGELVGAISLMGMVKNHQAELGYWVGVPYWNNGYCTEAGEALLKFGFNKLGLNRVHACYLSRNPASGRVLEKLGMQYEGTRQQHILKWDVYEDLAMMGVLKHEWNKIDETKK